MRARVGVVPRGVAARVPYPRHREVAHPPRPTTLPSDVLGVAAVFGVSLGALLISVVVGLVGPSWIVAVAMVACGLALALFVAARKEGLRATITQPAPAEHETR